MLSSSSSSLAATSSPGGGVPSSLSPSSSFANNSNDATTANADKGGNYLTGAVPTLVEGIFDSLAAGSLDRDTFPFVVDPEEEAGGDKNRGGNDGKSGNGNGTSQASSVVSQPSLPSSSSLAATGRSRSVRSTHSTAAAWASRVPGGGAGGGSFSASGLGFGGGGGGGTGNGSIGPGGFGNSGNGNANVPGRRVVVFVVGGVTRSEARAATAAAHRSGLRCVVGGTGLLSGPSFVRALRELGSLDYSHEVD